jgi:nucleotide-binding universal stress UspA family protein
MSQIVNEAQEWPADLIVLGANSYTTENKESRSVARSVVNHASCKVEVVEQGQQHGRGKEVPDGR